MLPWKSKQSRPEDIRPLHHDDFLKQTDPNNLNFLSFNVQVGIRTQAYHHYVTRSWQHVLPSRSREDNLKLVADVVKDFDIVALQEVDGGSLRSGFINQVHFLAEQADKAYWYQQLNRNLGVVAQHSNGLLSHIKPSKILDHKLPGFLPGRGAIVAEWGQGPDSLLVVMMHLALGRGGQNKQLESIREIIGDHHNVVLMGDMNTDSDHLLSKSPLKDLNLHEVDESLHTFPSWNPNKSLDHILVSDSLKVKRVSVIQSNLSDHLPIAMEIVPPVPLSH